MNRPHYRLDHFAPHLLAALVSLTTFACVDATAPSELNAVTAEVGADVTALSVAELQAAMERGELTATDLATAYLDRIDAYDRRGPALRAMITVIDRADAAAQATALDDERYLYGARGPLHGIPVIVKDSVNVTGFPATGGAIPLARSTPKADAFTIARLRDAGAIVLGKTNLDELQMGGSGQSGHGGQTRNPHALNRTPAGSSAGTGAGLAARFATVGIGADTNGSIRAPSSANHLVGLRPTMGLISRGGSMPGTDHLDVVGPMATRVHDLALLLDGIAGEDPADPMTARSAGRLPANGYAAPLAHCSVEGVRVGYIWNFLNITPDQGGEQPGIVETRAIAHAALAELEALTGEAPVAIDITSDRFQVVLEHLYEVFNAGRTAGATRARDQWTAYFKGVTGTDIGSLAGLIGAGNLFVDAPPEIAFFRWITIYGKLFAPAYDPAVEAALHAKQLALQEELARYMDELGIDAIVMPPIGKLPEIDENGSLVPGERISVPYNIDDVAVSLSSDSGAPTLTVPIGFTRDGVPVAFGLLGRAFSEPALLALGHAYERATDHQRLPASTPPL